MRDFTEAECRDMDALANRFFSAIERADIDAVERAYAPDVEYWTNVTRESLGLDAILGMVRLFSRKVRTEGLDFAFILPGWLDHRKS